jgi:hypothetical protein
MTTKSPTSIFMRIQTYINYVLHNLQRGTSNNLELWINQCKAINIV